MNLTADACGGPNPLVALSQNYSASYNGCCYRPANTCSSHSIADLLQGLGIQNTEGSTSAQGTSSQPNKASTQPQNQLQKAPTKHERGCVSSRVSQRTGFTPTTTLQLFSHRHQPRLRSVTKRDFELWVRRYHPRLLSSSRVVTVEPDVIAQEWLKGFDLSETLNYKSMSDIELLVEQWVQEFRLGQRLTPTQQSNFAELVTMENSHYKKEYTFTLEKDEIERMESQLELQDGILNIKQGNLSEAIRVFESVLLRERGSSPKLIHQQQSSSPEAWYYLGLCHQQLENEHKAIAAFLNVKESDFCYTATLLALSTSFINESRLNSAMLCIDKWIKIQGSSSTSVPMNARVLMSRVDALRDTDVDTVDRHVVKGILSCINNDLTQAIASFKAATVLVPHDFILWNRLGAVLANSNNFAESVEAYRNALSLSPGYVRARYNLGIACMNLMAYNEAIQQFLMCLEQSDSRDIWNVLRTALCLHKQYHLLVHLDARDVIALRREFPAYK